MLLFQHHAYAGILHLENEPARDSVVPLDRNQNATLEGKFDGIGQKIEQNLAHARRIRLDPLRHR